MLANAIFVATLVFLALSLWLMRALDFLIPWRSFLWHRYLPGIAVYAVLLFLNLLGLSIWVERKFFLRDAGRKLKHLDQEIHSGNSELSEEITAKFGKQ